MIEPILDTAERSLRTDELNIDLLEVPLCAVEPTFDTLEFSLCGLLLSAESQSGKGAP